MQDIRQKYTLGKELGRGQFGLVYLCTDNETGEKYAAKTIKKTKLASQSDIDDLKNEIEIMHHLAGHPSIVQLRDIFEDRAQARRGGRGGGGGEGRKGRCLGTG